MSWWYLAWLLPVAMVIVIIVAMINKRGTTATPAVAGGHTTPAIPRITFWGHVGRALGTLAAVLGILLIAILTFGAGSCAVGGYRWMREQATAKTYVVTSSTPAIRGVVYATTPVTITADYEFNIESDAPINIEYPGEKPVLYVPGKGFQQLPEPRRSGPKEFTDPNDAVNGHIAFRLYPVHNRE